MTEEYARLCHVWTLPEMQGFFFVDSSLGLQSCIRPVYAMAMTIKHLRRDQIWFVDKKNQKTILYPLKRAKPDKKVVRKGENLVKSYLSGDYGAVPEINDQLDLFNVK